MTKVKFTDHHGSPTMVDHTPSGADVEAGDIVVVGSGVRIAHTGIVDGVKGALAIGGGVYAFPKDDGVSSGMSAGNQAYFDPVAGEATEDGEDTIFAGTIVEDAADGDAYVLIYHHQPATVNTSS